MDNQLTQSSAVLTLQAPIMIPKQRMMTELVKTQDQDPKISLDFSKLPKSTMVQPLGR